MHSRRAVVVVVAVLGALACAPSARAQDNDAQTTATARSLFQEGMTFVEAHDWPNAVDRFRRVYALRPNGAVRLNLGLALCETGHIIEGTELLHQAAIDADTTGTVRRQAVAALPDLEAKIGRLTVHADTAGGGDVTLDGTPMAAATVGVAVPADPGAHTVTLVRAGATIATQTVTVPEGGAAEVTLTPTIAVPASGAGAGGDASATTHETHGGGNDVLSQWWFWTAVGGAVVLTAVIVIVAVAASGGTATPVSGNFDPPFLNVMVTR